MAEDPDLENTGANRARRVGAAEKARIIDGLIKGRDEAFERFVDLFGARIFGFAMKMCGNRADAEDVMQDTLVKALTSVRELRSPQALETWLYRIAANSCLMSRRKEKPSRNVELTGEETAGKGGGPGEPQWSRRPEELFLEKERLRILMEAIRSLPTNLRIVVVLRDMEGFSTREVAEILSVTEGNVKVMLHRARLRVRELFEAAYVPPDSGERP